MHRTQDGKFTIQFTTSEGGKVLPIQTEEGQWTHKNGRYTTRTLKVNGNPMSTTDPQYLDEYEVQAISSTEMTYRHLKMNITFQSLKVGSEFQVP